MGPLYLPPERQGTDADRKGEQPLDPTPPKGITPEEIIRRFAAKEKEFKTEWGHYTYRQSVKVQTQIGKAGSRWTQPRLRESRRRRSSADSLPRKKNSKPNGATIPTARASRYRRRSERRAAAGPNPA